MAPSFQQRYLKIFWTVVTFLCFHSSICHCLHVIPAPSKEELLAQMNNKTYISLSVTTTTIKDDMTPFPLKDHNNNNNNSSIIMSRRTLPIGHPDMFSHRVVEGGRSIVNSLSQQATNLGKGLLGFLRGNPLVPPRRPLMPHPGSHMLRLHPLPPGYNNHHPMSHDSMDKDRVGGGIPAMDKFEGGFLPSKKFVGDRHDEISMVSSSATRSTAINSTSLVLPTPKAPCDFYTDTLCLEAHPYPTDQLRHMLRLHLPHVRQMMAEVKEQNANVLVDGLTLQEEVLYSFEHYYGHRDNNTHSYRDYAEDGGFVCPSDIRYVRPQKGRSSSGKWKYIVNLDDFTQTIRLEKCLKHYSRCSYVFSYLNSECLQVYNYERLLAWDVNEGFHMDIFKIPVGCSCHIRSSSKINPSLSSTSPRMTLATSKFADAKDFVDSDVATDKSYATDSQPQSATSQPLSSFSQTPVVSPSQHVEAPLRRFPQMKPSRFRNSERQTVLNLPLEHSGQRNPVPIQNFHHHHHHQPNFPSNSENALNSNNVWNVKNHFSSEQEATPGEKMTSEQLGQPLRPLRLHHLSSSSAHRPFHHRIPDSDIVAHPPTTNVRRINYSKSPVSDFMHYWNG